jgi:hypothetical protein
MGKMRTRISMSGDSLVVVFVGVFSLLTSILIGLFYEIPAPKVHDEFAYLLAGDTFAKGRITNPTHPMWKHFETFHVFHLPTYQAKYPPGQGLFLALGKHLADLPILGVWLSLALACSATCWTLLAVFPRRWAFYGSMLATANPNILIWWGQSYWGGAVAMLGGALLFGSVFRFQQRLLLRHTLMFGLGITILGNSRPFEGAIACCTAIPIIIVGVRQWILNQQGKQLFWKFILPLSLILIFLAAWLLFYNYKLTGDMFTFPHKHWMTVTEDFVEFYNYWGAPDLLVYDKLVKLWYFFIGPILSIFILGFLSFAKDKNVIFSLLVVIVVTTIITFQSNAWPHYMAPISCLIFVLIIQGFKFISSFQRKGRVWGRYFIITIAVIYFIKSILSLSIKIYNGPRKDWAHARSAMIQCLKRHEPKDLIIVRYDTHHNVHREWVYNRADIDHAEVVWARELSPTQDKNLLAYFSDRQVWLLLADQYPPVLRPYPDTVANDDAVSRPPSFDIESCIRGT